MPQREVVSESTGVETSLRKGFPAIPTPEDIDFSDIEKPTFVTVAIAELDRKSNNGIHYDDDLLNAIERQVNDKRVGGIFGHVPKDQRAHAYPNPDAFWVGAKREGNILWGKAWIRNPEAARRVHDQKRVGGRLGTSIWGDAVHEQQQDGSVRLRNFVLESLDFASVERQSLSKDGAFVLTHEMTTETTQPEEVPVDKTQVIEFISKLNATEVAEMLTEDQRKTVAEIAAPAQAAAPVAELTQARSEVAELKTMVSAQQLMIDRMLGDQRSVNIAKAVAESTDWHVTTDQGKEALGSMRTNLTALAEMELAKDSTLTVDAAVEKAVERVKPVMEMTKNALSGGALAGGQRESRQQVNLPSEEEASAAAQKMGW